MEITTRDLWTVIHGMGFGALFMFAFSGALAQIYRMMAPGAGPTTGGERALFRGYLALMVTLAWAAVLSGAYIVYPWYRAAPPHGADLAGFPKALLISNPRTAAWHSVGMEWKEHVAWLAPIAMTMVAFIFLHYGASLSRFKGLRYAATGFLVVAMVATAIAGTFGAFLNKYAPVNGGAIIQLISSQGGDR